MTIVSKLFSPRYLFWTNTALGAGLLTTADVIEQRIQLYMATRDKEPEKRFDLKRTKVMAGGGVVMGSLGHLWYSFLDRRFPGKVNVWRKLGCEAALGPPLLLVVFMFVGAFEGKDWLQNWNSFKQSFVLLCLADWGFYVPLQYLNFYYLPPKYRFLFVAVVTLFYDTFLCFLLHRPVQKGPIASDNRVV